MSSSPESNYASRSLSSFSFSCSYFFNPTKTKAKQPIKQTTFITIAMPNENTLLPLSSGWCLLRNGFLLASRTARIAKKMTPITIRQLQYIPQHFEIGCIFIIIQLQVNVGFLGKLINFNNVRGWPF